ncbi:Short-chain dehydrogenase reductase ATR7 [Hyphodiscus hymeniophilus]|uniref:Short-chain dehydrogenase reductase ATR7 n=1 Tax=Hyphodiscus hymeniophilus TaxID=353542 RepID=A0A9P6VGS4_9HELO|nr:Short-chain dehydrogenase reductase ATR7 [Hyphodiscus hymeniophilus]
MASTENRVAIITGAASGMGLAVTKHLIAKGWRVCMSDINKQHGDALALELGDKALFVDANVTDYDSQAQVFETVWLKWKRIDFVAANAGIVDNFPLCKAGKATRPTVRPPKPDLTTIEVDLNGAIYTVYLALHYMRMNSTPGGKITITASSAALYPLDTVPLYAAAKHAIIGLIRSMAPVLESENITLNCFCPGLSESPQSSSLVPLSITSHSQQC